MAGVGLAGRLAVAAAAAAAALALAGAAATATFVVDGRGFGHGIGMSQYGADGFARHGWNHLQILEHYYPHTGIAAVPARTRVRVLLDEGEAAVVVRSPTPVTLTDGARRGATLPAGSYRIDGSFRVHTAAGELVPVPPLRFDRGGGSLEVDGNPYRGAIVVGRAGGGVSVVDELGVDDYVRGVVSWEVSSSWPREALETQAVAARSYVLSELDPARSFDVYRDTRSQMYGGVRAETRSTDAAVAATAGQVLVWRGHVASTFFSSSSGGRTAAIQDVWPAAQAKPYLVSVPDPYDTVSPEHRWRPFALSGASLGARLGVGAVDAVSLTRNRSGRVAWVVVRSDGSVSRFSGDSVMRALGLRSTWFDIHVPRQARQLRPHALAPLRRHGGARPRTTTQPVPFEPTAVRVPQARSGRGSAADPTGGVVAGLVLVLAALTLVAFGCSRRRVASLAVAVLLAGLRAPLALAARAAAGALAVALPLALFALHPALVHRQHVAGPPAGAEPTMTSAVAASASEPLPTATAPSEPLPTAPAAPAAPQGPAPAAPPVPQPAAPPAVAALPPPAASPAPIPAAAPPPAPAAAPRARPAPILHLPAHQRGRTARGGEPSPEPPPPPPAQPAPPQPAPPPPPPPGPLEISGVQVAATSPTTAVATWQTSLPAGGGGAAGSGADPSVWTPFDVGATTQHQTVFSGLRPGTVEHLWLRAHDQWGQTATVTADVTPPPLSTAPRAATSGSAIVLDGQQFFPLMLWQDCADDAQAKIAAGINLFLGNSCGDDAKLLAKLAGRAYAVADASHADAPTPGLIGWYYRDEWDAWLSGDTAYDALRTAAPAPPPGLISFLTMTYHFYSGGAPLAQGRGVYPSLVRIPDVVGFDLYPLQSWCSTGSFGAVADSQAELRVLSGGKPGYQWIETRAMDCGPGRGLDPTAQTVRAETWLALAGGASGVGYFPNDWAPDIAATIAQANAEISELAPALLAPSGQAGSDAPAVKVSVRTLNGASYVIAVNTTQAPVDTTIRVAGLDAPSAGVLDEQRAVPVTAGTFADHFDALGVHVYVIAPPTWTASATAGTSYLTYLPLLPPPSTWTAALAPTPAELRIQ